MAEFGLVAEVSLSAAKCRPNDRFVRIGQEVKQHKGVDIAIPVGTKLYSAVKGTVTVARYSDSAGYMVTIQNDNGWTVTFMHMNNFAVRSGQNVEQGDYVGESGNTGNSTGTHLHLEASLSQSWNCNTFLSPGNCLGFGNTRGTVIVYDGSTPVPPTPTPATWIYQDAYNSQSEMENNANCVINYYRNQGIADKTIAAILGNMQAESTIQPILNEVGRWRWLWFSSMDTKIKFNKSRFSTWNI